MWNHTFLKTFLNRLTGANLSVLHVHREGNNSSVIGFDNETESEVERIFWTYLTCTIAMTATTTTSSNCKHPVCDARLNAKCNVFLSRNDLINNSQVCIYLLQTAVCCVEIVGHLVLTKYTISASLNMGFFFNSAVGLRSSLLIYF